MNMFSSVVLLTVFSSLAFAQSVPPILHDGTALRLRLNRNLSSADAKTGETVDFEILDDVKVNELVVIKKGSSAMGTITEAHSKRRMGRAGKLNITIDYARLTDDRKVALRAVKDTKGGGNTGKMTGAIVATSIVFFPVAPLFLLVHGKDIAIPKGTEITAYVNGDMSLDTANFAPVFPAAPITVSSSEAEIPLRNDDVVALKAAGLSDDLIITKIKTSVAKYALDTNDLIALKKAGLSEAVIKAMLESRERLTAPPTRSVDAPQPVAVAKYAVPPPPVVSSYALNDITILSQPSGAYVYVEGIPTARTPAVVKLQAGTYKVTLKSPGYQSYTQQITVEAGQVRSFGVALEIEK